MPGSRAPLNVSVVVATRNRRDELLRSLDRLTALPDRPPVIVVDNGSEDGSPDAVRARHPEIDVVALPTNLGAAARNVGARRARTPYVAFSDDDSWWAPGALVRAAEHLDRCPEVALVAARILLDGRGREEPVCREMAESPLGTAPGDPGPTLLGFVACGAVVRRAAFLDAGGFDARFGVGGEEALVALDLADRGQRCVYAADVVAHHHPSPVRHRGHRERVLVRNHLWTTWLRRPFVSAVRETARCLGPALADANRRAGVIDAVRGLPGVVADRRVVGPTVETGLQRLASGTGPAPEQRPTSAFGR